MVDAESVSEGNLESARNLFYNKRYTEAEVAFLDLRKKEPGSTEIDFDLAVVGYHTKKKIVSRGYLERRKDFISKLYLLKLQLEEKGQSPLANEVIDEIREVIRETAGLSTPEVRSLLWGDRESAEREERKLRKGEDIIREFLSTTNPFLFLYEQRDQWLLELLDSFCAGWGYFGLSRYLPHFAEALHKLGERDLALKYYEASLGSHPGHKAEILLSIGQVWEETDLDKACSYYRQAREADPENLDILLALGFLLLRLDNEDEAIQCFVKVAKQTNEEDLRSSDADRYLRSRAGIVRASVLHARKVDKALSTDEARSLLAKALKLAEALEGQVGVDSLEELGILEEARFLKRFFGK